MPSKPKRLCTYRGCAAFATSNDSHCQAHRRKANRDYNLTRPDHNKVYDNDWRKFSLWYKRQNPLCEECKRNGIEEEVEEVHHIIPIKECPERKYDPTNVESLCKSCHSKKTMKEANKCG